MKNRIKFLERMSEIDDELLVLAEPTAQKNGKSVFCRKWVIAAAAILAICAISLTVVVLHFKKQNEGVNGDINDIQQAPISDIVWVDNRKRNDKHSILGENAYVWPWNCRDVYNQYTTVTIGQNEYTARSSHYGAEVLANQIVKKLYDAEAKGYDDYSLTLGGEDYYRYLKCEVFEISGVDSNRIVAVKYDGYDGYYAFINGERKQPNTLGDLVSALDLTKQIKLNSFYYDAETDGNDEDEHYALSNESSEALWNILKECESAPSVDSSSYDYAKRKISFAIDSATLGVYNLSLSFSENGYLWTNIEDYAYVYDIGKEAVEKIVDLATKNGLVVLLEEKQYLIGTVTEIGEDYIKVDDSAMMKISDEGIEFTVYANHMNIRRYIISGYLKVGDIVRVEHGYLSKDNYTQIKNAVDIAECIITSDGQTLIPE